MEWNWRYGPHFELLNIFDILCDNRYGWDTSSWIFLKCCIVPALDGQCDHIRSMIVPKFLTCSRLGFLGGVNMPRSVLALRSPCRCVNGFLPTFPRNGSFEKFLAASSSRLASPPSRSRHFQVIMTTFSAKGLNAAMFCDFVNVYYFIVYEQSCNVLL